jgi:hypothetical protein
MTPARTGWITRLRGWQLLVAAPAVLLLAAPVAVVALTASPAQAGSNPPLVWSAPENIETVGPYSTGTALNSVSCPTTSLCVAGDAAGNVLTSTDPTGGASAWHLVPLASTGYVYGVTCATASFCSALVNGVAYTSTDPAEATSWTASQSATRLTVAPYISCPDTGLCVAGGQYGNLNTSTDPSSANASWKPVKIDGGANLTGLACPTDSLCVATDGNGNVLISTDPTGGVSAWGTTDIDGAAGLSDLTCPSASFCMAADSLGRLVYSTNPTGGAAAWQLVGSPNSTIVPQALTCSSANLCVAVDDNTVFATTNPTGGSSAWQATDADESADINAVSCPDSSLCVAVDTHGNVVSATNPVGTSPSWTVVSVDGTSDITALDCPTANFCAAGDDSGRVFTSTNPTGGPATWQRAEIDTVTAGLTGISCPSSGLCVAVDRDADVLASADPTGGASTWVTADFDNSDPFQQGGFYSVSCPTVSLCVVGDYFEVLTSTDPAGGASAWTTTGVASGPFSGGVVGPNEVSCASDQLCAATIPGHLSWPIDASTDPTGGTSAWTSASLANATLGYLDCPSSTLCIADGEYVSPKTQADVPAEFTSTDPAGGDTAWQVTQTATELGLLACPSSSECFAFPTAGEMLTSTDPTGPGSSWQQSGGPDENTAVSCPTVSLCVAADGGSIQIGTPPVATTTAVSGPGTAVVGQTMTVGVKVTSAEAGTGAATPGGTATITAGRRSCTATLSGTAGVASGSCKITEPAPGSYRVSASYPAQGSFASSTASRLLKVGKAAARVALKLSAGQVRYGQEHTVRLSVTVKSQYTGTPSGKIVILAGSKTICSVYLRNGKASCLLAGRQLRPGRYALRARYDGNTDFKPGYSPYERIRIT